MYTTKNVKLLREISHTDTGIIGNERINEIVKNTINSME